MGSRVWNFEWEKMFLGFLVMCKRTHTLSPGNLLYSHSKISRKSPHGFDSERGKGSPHEDHSTWERPTVLEKRLTRVLPFTGKGRAFPSLQLPLVFLCQLNEEERNACKIHRPEAEALYPHLTTTSRFQYNNSELHLEELKYRDTLEEKKRALR